MRRATIHALQDELLIDSGMNFGGSAGSGKDGSGTTEESEEDLGTLDMGDPSNEYDGSVGFVNRTRDYADEGEIGFGKVESLHLKGGMFLS